MDADEPATLTGFLDSSAPLRCKRDRLTPTDLDLCQYGRVARR